MRLVRHVRVNAPKRSFVSTPYGRVAISIEDGREVADATGGAARVLVRLHGFTPAGPADDPTVPAQNEAQEAPRDAAPSDSTKSAPAIRLATLEGLAVVLGGDITREEVEQLLVAEQARPKPRKGAVAMLEEWLAR